MCHFGLKLPYRICRHLAGQNFYFSKICRDATVYREDSRLHILAGIRINRTRAMCDHAELREAFVLTPSVVSKPKKESAICENEICKMTCSD